MTRTPWQGTTSKSSHSKRVRSFPSILASRCISPLLSPLFSVFRAARGLEHSSTLNMSGKRPERPPKRGIAADADGHMLKAIRAAAGGGVELRPVVLRVSTALLQLGAH